MSSNNIDNKINIYNNKLPVLEMILFLFKSIFKILIILLLIILGILLISIFLFRTEEFNTLNPNARILPNGKKNRKFKDRWVDNIFGNEDDGLFGDDNYWKNNYHKPSFWSAYNWAALRNPLHNFTKKIGVNAYITRYDVYKYGSLIYSKAYDINDKTYQMIRFKKIWKNNKRTDIYIGYKNFNINKVPAYYIYQFSMKFNILRKN